MWQAERRKHPRYKVSIFSKTFDVILLKETEANTCDISAQGIGLISKEALPAGANIEIWLYMPDNNEQIHAKGHVVWSQKLEPDQYRIGIQLNGSDLKPVPMVLRTIRPKTRYYYFL